MFHPLSKLIDFPIQNVWGTLKGHLCKTMVAYCLLHAKGNCIFIEAFSLKIGKDTLEQLVYVFRVGILSFNFGQEAEQVLTISVEEDDLNPNFLSYVLPRPVLVLKVIERWMKKKGWGGRQGGH